MMTAYDVFGGSNVMFGNAGINLMKDFRLHPGGARAHPARQLLRQLHHHPGRFRAFVAHETKGVTVNTASINVRLACPEFHALRRQQGRHRAMTAARRRVLEVRHPLQLHRPAHPTWSAARPSSASRTTLRPS
ncbi:MAG: hypothetical protein ACLUEK_11955 [Oscillospiraceae bacterium]